MSAGRNKALSSSKVSSWPFLTLSKPPPPPNPCSDSLSILGRPCWKWRGTHAPSHTDGHMGLPPPCFSASKQGHWWQPDFLICFSPRSEDNLSFMKVYYGNTIFFQMFQLHKCIHTRPADLVAHQAEQSPPPASNPPPLNPSCSLSRQLLINGGSGRSHYRGWMCFSSVGHM